MRVRDARLTAPQREVEITEISGGRRVFGRELRTWILGLSPQDVVLLTRHLLIAEAGRLGLPSGAVSMPGEIYSPDGGVDGHTDLGEHPAPPFPAGPVTWQVKATTRFSVTHELAKPDVIADIEAGRDYVIVCSQPFRGATLTRRAGDLVRGVAAISADRRGILLGVDDLERMIRTHPTVPALLNGPAPLGISIDMLASPLDVYLYRFVADERRQAIVEAIRTFARGDSPQRVHLHIFGDSGVGKSRAVYEALAVEDLRHRSAWWLNYSEEAQRALRAFAATGEASAIVVVDETSPAQVEALQSAAALSRGRLRLITIGDRQSRAAQGDASSLDVLPLSEGSIRPLVSRVGGLTDEEAGYVAGLSEGYPKLAVLLAQALRSTRTRGRLIELIRGRQVAQLLEEMIADPPTRDHLAHLSLVHRLGFEAELAPEAVQFCGAFELPYHAFCTSVGNETNRFVATAGRYRRVSPRALALWLAQGLIDARGDHVVESVGRLPEPLQASFRAQLQELGGTESFDLAIEELVARRVSQVRGLADLMTADADLLNSVAFAAPGIAMAQLGSLVRSAPDDVLLALGPGQRGAIVGALEHLLWFADTYQPAAEALLALACNETESWANNATGVLAGSFQVHLGGTEVPLPARFEWLREHLADFGERSATVATRAVASSLQPSETRVGGWRGARLQPVEWQPSGPDEVRELHRAAYALLLDIAAQFPDLRDAVADVMARGLWVLMRSGGLPTFVGSVGEVDWPAAARAKLVARVRQEMGFNEALSAQDRDALATVASELEGASSRSRLETILATELWNLAPVRRPAAVPAPITEMAHELATIDSEALVERVTAVLNPISSTLFALFAELGEQRPDASELAHDRRLPDVARVALIGGLSRRDPSRSRAVVEVWAGDILDARLVPWAVSAMPPTPGLLPLAISVAERGHAPLSDLNRFQYGRWADALPVGELRALAELYLRFEPHQLDLEAILGVLTDWLEANRHEAPQLADVGRRLLAVSAEVGGRGMLTLQRNQLADLLELPVDVRLAITLRAIERCVHADDEDVGALSRLAVREPDVVATAVVDFVAAPDPSRIMLEREHLLSVIARAAGTQCVLRLVLALDPPGQLRALRHVDFTQPDLDPIAVGVLEANVGNAEFIRHFTASFLFPGEVVLGPYSNRLQERLTQAQRLAAEHPSASVRAWAPTAARALEQMLPDERQREAERD
jgi:hypothetical protein